VTGLVGGVSQPAPHVPTGALYTVLVIVHVLCAVIGFGAVVLTGVQAGRARRGPDAPGADGTRRYFRPGTNWAGRTIYGVPVFGFASIAASSGAWRPGDEFVVVGLLLWLTSAVVAELVVWPAERRIQVIVTQSWGEVTSAPALERACRRVAGVAALVGVLFVVAVVVMVARP
jgi:Predicted integral membrane protein (DUF2269)